MDLLLLVLTLLVAGCGSFLFRKLKVPAGGFLGPMLFVTLFNIFTGLAFFPADIKTYVRIFAGALIGSRVKGADLPKMKMLFVPGVLLVIALLIVNMSLGYGIHSLTGLNLATALLGSAPGGVQDMVLIAEDLGADAAQIALLQSVRIMVVLGTMPFLLRIFSDKYRSRKIGKNDGNAAETLAENGTDGEYVTEEASDSETKIKGDYKNKAIAFARTMVFAFIGGLLLDMTAFPAGAMVGAMIGTVASSLFIKPSYVPKRVRVFTMLCSGLLIGSGIGIEQVIGLKQIIVPSILLVISLFIANFGIGMLLHKVTKIDLITALFSSSAGGLSDLSLIADDMGADSVKVTMLQLFRHIFVPSLFPLVIKLLSSLAGN